MDDIGYVLLAGGAGKRMGNQNKLNMPYKASTFGEVLKEELRAIGGKCFISIAEYEYDQQDDFEVIKDEVKDEEDRFIGPMGGIYSSLKKAQSQDLKGIFIVSCDMPFFRKEIFLAMKPFVNDKDVILVKTMDKQVHYTCGYYAVRILPILDEMIREKNYRLRDAFDKCNTYIVGSNRLGLKEECFFNVNNREQYLELLKSSEDCKGDKTDEA